MNNSLCKSKVGNLQQRIFIIFNKKNVLFAKPQNSGSDKLEKFNHHIILELSTIEYSEIEELKTRHPVNKPGVLGLDEPHYCHEAFADQMLKEGKQREAMSKAHERERGRWLMNHLPN